MSSRDTTPQGSLVLVRHGQTEWSAAHRHTGLTDIPLLPEGEDGARQVGPALARFDFALVLSSPLQRARHTAELAGFTPEVDEHLVEWDYGGYEGRTTAEIREELGHPWTVFADGVIPGETPGETVEQVAARASLVLARIWPALEKGDVALFGHGHALRILAATYLRQEPRMGGQLLLDPGTVSVLTHEREQPAIKQWNAAP